MALFNAIPYNYVPTASRLKNSIPRHESTQKESTPNDTAVVATADDEGYKPTFLDRSMSLEDEEVNDSNLM
ncbi:hypothetical protein BOTNAR_0277g00180 [Botryotinia narcissicola]|uniref:Uncharacterized protein n=1 Tax=Botryotinia narcissicola TaxID=278944 RepID=A0A4Z1IB94_9HELO|nr:hypothetical protein BOTNAR_0277g00180 [Botryotinia narcissicola]